MTIVIERAEVARVARDAAGIIDRNGWYVGAFYDIMQPAPAPLCRVCAAGAIRLAAGAATPEVDSQLANAVEAAFANWLYTTGRIPVLARSGDDGEADSPVNIIGAWNDDVATSQTEVIEALRVFADARERRDA